MPEYVFSEKRKSWEFYEKQQEEALRNALNPELWAWLKEQTERERGNQKPGTE